MNFTAIFFDKDDKFLGSEYVQNHRPQWEWNGQTFNLVAITDNCTVIRYKLV